MLANFPFYLGILLVILLLIMLANKIKAAYPILLVIAGLVISFIPGIPVINIEPDLIFFIFLPPLLYEAAWAVSWKELWRWRRIITSFAFVVVFVTALSVAIVANYVIPVFSLVLGFVLSGIELRNKVHENEDLRIKSIPYLFFTTSAQQSHVIDAYSKSIQGFFVKPNDYSEIKNTVQTIVEYWLKCVSPNYVK